MHKFVNRGRSFYKSVYIIWNIIAINNSKDANFCYKGVILLILAMILSNNFKNTNLGQEKQHSFWIMLSGI